MRNRIFIILFCIVCVSAAGAQLSGDTAQNKKSRQVKFNEYCLDSSVKNRLFIFRVDKGSHTAITLRNPSLKIPDKVSFVNAVKQVPFLKIHGNILYDVNYYSNIDTPYSQKDVYQHTVQTYLDISVKDNYPVRFYFTTRFSNSYLFKNFSDVNLLYNSQQFRQNIREKLKQGMLSSMPSLPVLDSLKNLLDSKYRELSGLERKQSDPALLQKMVEARERIFFKKRSVNIVQYSLPANALQNREQKNRVDDEVNAGKNLDSVKATGDKIKGQNSPFPIKESIERKIADSLTVMSSRKNKSDSLSLLKKDTSGRFLRILNRLDSSSKKILRLKESLSALTLKKSPVAIPADSLPSLDGVNGGSIKNENSDSLMEQSEKDHKRIDSLRLEISALQQKYNHLRSLSSNNSGMNAKEIDAIQNPKELESKMRQYNIPDSAMPQGYKTMMALRSAGIGRNIVNYSELSVKNISINGVQAEYNPSFYVAFAAGSVDYRFRDFIVQNYHQPQQYVAVVRAGMGMKEGNNVIFTYYAGRRQLYNSFTDTVNQVSQALSPYLMGFTIEGNYRLGKNHLLTGEIAKSSMPYYSIDNKPGDLLSGTIRFKDHSNEAYSIKLASFIPDTKTTINAYYKRLGINFQSFSIFTNGSAQSAWNIRVAQPFFKRTLEVVASVNANDFSNPYIPQGYKSSTVFKSLQATLRKNKWPVISLGYFPSSQLTRLNDDQYVQNLFYTMVGNISHYYRAGSTMYSTSLIYTQFYNRSADSNFIYFNTKNLLINQSIFLQNITLQFNASESVNNYYKLYTGESNAQFNCNKWLSMGAGIKYNFQTVYQLRQWGYSGNMTIKIPMLGEFRMMADRGFIPGAGRQLVSNNAGRFTYFKTF